jgi:carnitine-CoA ligase
MDGPIQRKPGFDLSADGLVRWMIPRMPRFMIPRFVEFMDELPRAPDLKIQKAVLRRSPLGDDIWDREKAGVSLPG